MSVCFDKDVRDTANNKRKKVATKKNGVVILPQDSVVIHTTTASDCIVLESVASTDSYQSKQRVNNVES
jgi:hypothetical protein